MSHFESQLSSDFPLTIAHWHQICQHFISVFCETSKTSCMGRLSVPSRSMLDTPEFKALLTPELLTLSTMFNKLVPI